MAIPAFQRRFCCAHTFSLVAACFAVGTAAIFVVIRIQRLPTPVVPEADVTALVDSILCDCTCSEKKDLMCVPKVANETEPELAVLNKTGCFLGVAPGLAVMGPTPTAHNCSCTDEGYMCRTTFEYELESVQFVTRASVAQILVAFVILVWDIQYLVSVYFFVLPSAPEDVINIEWLQHWLKGYWDPLHSAALWTIWGQVLAVGVAPMGMQSPFPRLREFVAPDKLLQAGWAPTGIDELVLWCCTALLALAALVLMCRTPSAALEESAEQQQVHEKAQAPEQQTFVRTMLTGILILASLGFIVGQPISSLYAFLATVPCWLVQAHSRWQAAWPLERPFPGLRKPWVLPAKELRSQEDASRLIEELEAQQTQKHSFGPDFGGRVQGLCRTVQKLQQAIPWRSPMDLDKRLQAVVLHGLRSTVETRNACEMRRLLKAAQLLGYIPPPADDSEEELEAQAQTRKGCCGRLVGYQRLGEDRRKGAPLVRDETWSADVYETLRGGLRNAVEAARVLEDDASLRWLGDILTALRPDTMPELCAQMARAADTLTGLIEDVHWEPRELYSTVSAAAGLQPDAEGPSGLTACGWALGLKPQQMRGTMALLLQRLRGNVSTPACDSLKVVEGPAEEAIIEGTRVFAGRAVTVAVPEFAVGGGRWFFEVILHGHSAMASAAESRAGLFGVTSRFGWLHEADCHQRERASIGPADFKGLTLPTSCHLGLFSSGTFQSELNAFEYPPGRGVIGCALEVSGKDCRAWFALDGVWNRTGAGWDENSEDIVHSKWVAKDSDGPVCPAISGRLVCNLAFQASHYVHGPPDPSFRPIAEATGSASAAHGAMIGTEPTTIGAAFEPADPEVFEIGDDQC